MKELKEAALITATTLGAAVVAKIALPDETPVEKTVHVEKTPNERLMEAAIMGDIKAYEQALADSGNINYQDPNTGKTVLMATIDNNSSIMEQGRACEIVKMSLATGNVDLTLKDSQGKTLKDYIKSTKSTLDNMASSYVTPQTYATGRAAESLSKDWESVLQTIEKMQPTAQAKKTNYHAFYQAINLRK